MEEKRSSARTKRHSKAPDEGYWDCSVCTYKNSPEAYKCDMCDVRKGTSTRKPRLNAQLVAQQVAQQFAPPPKKEKSNIQNSTHTGSKKEKDSSDSSKESNSPPRLKNVDRNNATQMAVTVGSVTVIITDYQPKKDSISSSSSSSSENQLHSDTGSDTNSSYAGHDANEDSPAENGAN